MNITETRLKELEKAERKLRALERGGVDNWTFYGEAMDELIKEEEAEERLIECLVDIEVALMNGAYEPSERGAGYCASESGRQEATRILSAYVKELTAKQ